jgi:tRNA U34 5-methylaminomethyl-2-thiouridine-forming methyltransferase MnmC
MEQHVYPVITGDVSHTHFHGKFKEHYHSTFGAIQESLHVYIESGFNCFNSNEVSILEIGFGTGLNALLTLIASQEKNCRVTYHTIENYPLPEQVISLLNYDEQLSGKTISGPNLNNLHGISWGVYVSLTPDFIMHKIKADFNEFEPDFNYDLVYFDAFAPDVQPEIWSEANLQKVYRNMNMGGCLVTYCVKGQVKRDLHHAGFCIEVLPGPPGKRHMLRARKTNT